LPEDRQRLLLCRRVAEGTVGLGQLVVRHVRFLIQLDRAGERTDRGFRVLKDHERAAQSDKRVLEVWIVIEGALKERALAASPPFR
jgi:hypothetical protein